jgi:hypothetical protein
MSGWGVLLAILKQIYIFLLLAIACSLLYELLESILKNRAKGLERGIGELIGDPANTSKCIDAIYNHGLVNSLFKGAYPPARKADLPAYIPARNFALAVMDVARNPPPGVSLPANLQDALRSATTAAGGDFDKFRGILESWFNAGMDRVSDWYKRRAQWTIVALSFAIVFTFNLDMFHFARERATDDSYRKHLLAELQACENPTQRQPPTISTSVNASPTNGPDCYPYQEALEYLEQPFGWTQFDITTADGAPASPFPERMIVFWSVIFERHLFGWIASVIAISLSAPPLFDLLNKYVPLRSTFKPERGAP